MSGGDPVYLDYAATSAVRPDAVVEAVARYLRDVGATPGRAGHRRALEAGRTALRCRRVLALLFNLPGDPGRIAFQLNATHALNLALLGLLRPGDRVVRTPYDHNAVRRPVGALAALRGVEEVVLAGDAEGGVDLDEAERLLAGARLLALPHASNVLGSALPVRALAERAHAAGALVLLDAAQTAGHLPVDAQALGVDLLAFSGHKGLLGPQGTGGLWVREGVEVDPLFAGGTGGDSGPLEMPASLPDRLEAGTQNGPGIAGLLAGVEWLLERGVGARHAREAALKAQLRAGLAAVPGVWVRSPAAPDGVGIVTVTADALEAGELALRLDREHGVLTRAGLHCAPEAHVLLGTASTGAVRFSVGWATTAADVDRAVAAVRALAGAAARETMPLAAG
ncbi:MAG TPA: aminotransferase class V-fold PLP-dependent enzyme [Longimicrobiaceae bacterium]|nr:aminotransferase class V-fold PLP-dependent enzyme [Longimicrobiaceae bacterium]